MWRRRSSTLGSLRSRDYAVTKRVLVVLALLWVVRLAIPVVLVSTGTHCDRLRIAPWSLRLSCEGPRVTAAKWSVYDDERGGPPHGRLEHPRRP